MENHQTVSLPQLGSKVPDFEATTTFGKIKLSEYQKGCWVILFSHPGDFTPVCTTEMIAFAESYELFCQKNTKLLGLSVDGVHSHLGWVDNIYNIADIQIPFPIIADSDRYVSKLYGMLSDSMSSTATVRAVFIIDPEGILRLIQYYPMVVGRNIMEILRVLDALQFVDANKTPTPANWVPGTDAVLPPPNTYEELKRRTRGGGDYHCLDWYLCFTDKRK